MRRLLASAVLVLVICTSLFAANVYSSFGLSGLYNQAYSDFELGLYSNFIYAMPVYDGPVSIGFGSRADFSFSIPINLLSLAFITGLGIDVEITDAVDFYAIAGPGVYLNIPDYGTVMACGGAVDLGLIIYLNSSKTSGLTAGSVNYFSSYLKRSGERFFGYYGGIYLGFSVRIKGNSSRFRTLPDGYEYIRL